jgi:uncharacterized protein YkwD
MILALAMGATASAAKTRGHRAVRCGRSGRIHGRAGSFHTSFRQPAAHRRPACSKRRRRHSRHARPHHRRVTVHRASPRSSAADGGCPDAELRPSREDLQRVREATFCLVNLERTARGEPALHFNSHLEAAAQGHSESMAGGDYFDHIGPGGQTPLDRMKAAGYIYSSRIGFEVGENIAWGTGSLSTPRSIVAGWMASPGHRANILDAHFRDGGIGVAPQGLASQAHGQAGGMYTQDFGVIVGG